MKDALRISCARWLLVTGLLVSVYVAAQGALLVYALRSGGDAGVFRPPSAEEVSRGAAPYQANTRETDGMFRIVQRQHSELGFAFSYLQAATQTNWSMAITGTVVSSLQALLLAVAFCLLPRAPAKPGTAQSKPAVPRADNAA